jgi:hypothetical protein
MHKPKAAAPTTEETVLRQRQVDELARLDDEENRRLKVLVRGRSSNALTSRRSAGGRGSGGADSGGSASLGGGAPRGSLVGRMRVGMAGV